MTVEKNKLNNINVKKLFTLSLKIKGIFLEKKKLCRNIFIKFIIRIYTY